jgi:histidyl-tRNA synthetase
MIQLIRGFKDILTPEVELWQHIEKTAVALFHDHGFKEIRVPILESTELFSRSIGEHTDIVEKEMYTFADRKGELITLRPEATASVVRAYIQHSLHASDPVQKFFTIGPMFRRERPQKGRYRQFYQINAEVFGVASPLMDARLIFMAMSFFRKLDVPDIAVHVNSLGCAACRPAFKSALADYLSGKAENLCADCKVRSVRNPLRVLDCKVPECGASLDGSPAMQAYLCQDCTTHFETVKHRLKELGVSFIQDDRLVRGLDYYTRTTFEIRSGALGAQSAVAGGGRYDGLVGMLGGPDQPAIGFAVGIDRLAAILSEKNADYSSRPAVFVAALGDAARIKASDWTCRCAEQGLWIEMEYENRSLKSQMKRADRLGAPYVLIVGENELQQGIAVLRNMHTKQQEEIDLDQVERMLVEKLKGREL